MAETKRSRAIRRPDSARAHASRCARKLAALAEPTRLAVLRALLDSPRRVGELAEGLDVEQSLLSHHLRSLRDAGLVRSVRQGKGVLYHLAPDVGLCRPRDGLDLGCCEVAFASPTGRRERRSPS